MDTERRMTTQEMLTQHKKLMDEAQRLEPSVMVTERNWNAMLKMQHDLFQQQMQLDTDLKMLQNASDESRSTGSPDRDAGERDRVRRTGWEPERGVFFRLQGTDREYTEFCDFDFGERRTGDFYGDTRSEEENSPVRVDLNRGIDLVRGAVRLGRAVEQMTDDAPTRDGTTMPLHIDSKRRKKLRQKKTALGHQEDDHEDCRMEQQL